MPMPTYARSYPMWKSSGVLDSRAKESSVKLPELIQRFDATMTKALSEWKEVEEHVLSSHMYPVEDETLSHLGEHRVKMSEPIQQRDGDKDDIWHEVSEFNTEEVSAHCSIPASSQDSNAIDKSIGVSKSLRAFSVCSSNSADVGYPTKRLNLTQMSSKALNGLERHWHNIVARRVKAQSSQHLSPVDIRVHGTRRKGDSALVIVYELVMAVVIISNAAYIGWQVNNTEETSTRIWVDCCFLAVYSLDMCIRFYHERNLFFKGRNRNWNMFDLLIVLCMAVELIFISLSHLAVLRAVRLLRLARFCRLLRFAKHIRELFFIVHVFRSSTMWRILVWVLLLGVGFCYVCAVVLVDGVQEACEKQSALMACKTFGSLFDASMTLTKTMFGGVHWGELYEILEPIGWFETWIFFSFSIFSVVIVQNMLLCALMKAFNDCCSKELDMVISDSMSAAKDKVYQLMHVFELADTNDSGEINEKELGLALRDQKSAALLSAFGIFPEDVSSIFEFFDVDQSGSIDIFEFVVGCMKIQNGTNALDLSKLVDDVCIIKERLGIAGSLSLLELPGIISTNSADMMLHSSTPQGAHSEIQIALALEDLVEISELEKHVLPLLKDPSHTGKPIPKTEMRAMSLVELRGLKTLLTHASMNGQWIDEMSGTRLKPENVNLYQLCYCCILGLTAPEGVVLSGLEQGIYVEGQEVVQYDASSRGTFPVAVGRVLHYDRGRLSVSLDRGCFRHSGLGDFPVVVDGNPCGVPKEVSVPRTISFKELLSSTPSKPEWFCSHWWGEKIFDFVAACQEHSRLRQTHSYWICAYANRQHSIEDDIVSNPEHTSFRKAMHLAMGVLLHLDEDATPFSRVWCDFELTKNLSVDSKLLDIATVYTKRRGKKKPTVLVDGILQFETAIAKNQRENDFPIDIITRGLSVKLQEGHASVEKDRDAILACIKKDAQKAGLDPENAFDHANAALHFQLATAVWPQAVKRGLVEQLDLPNILAQGGSAALNLSLAALSEVKDADVHHLAQGLSKSLRRLHLSFSRCQSITNSGISSLAQQLPESLETMWLDFTGCTQISDEGVNMIAEGLGRNLQELRLDFADCYRLTESSISTLVSHFPESLGKVSACFIGTKIDQDFISKSELKAYTKRSHGNPSHRHITLKQGHSFETLVRALG